VKFLLKIPFLDDRECEHIELISHITTEQKFTADYIMFFMNFYIEMSNLVVQRPDGKICKLDGERFREGHENSIARKRAEKENPF